MAKFKVNVGGYVTAYRERNLIIYADDEAEAEKKASDKFVDLQQKPGHMCDEGTINYIERM